MRLAADTGGTFTDLVVEHGDAVHLYKAATTPDNPAEGILNAIALAAGDAEMSIEEFLGETEIFIHGTTRAINAILTNTTARTALLATRGHPDMLLLREGGRTHPFDWSYGYPDPYIPRALTYEVDERIGSQGEVVRPLDEPGAIEVIGRLAEKGVESVAVCLLWSIANPVHELVLGELLERHLPGIPYTLSHALNPTLREYRRASGAAIDASLKPLMTNYLRGLEERLRAAGFSGRLLMVTSSGGVVDAEDMAAAPIHSVNSGPAMAPVAGRRYAALDGLSENAVVADTGGTSYDVALVRRGRIPVTRETWLGIEYEGHITGFPAVDVRSVGAGGGSIAWIDSGGLLHVGPQSAGADPGPVCYARGGVEPTVTDAAVVLGYIDPDYFLGGAMKLDAQASIDAITERVGRPLGLDTYEAAVGDHGRGHRADDPVDRGDHRQPGGRSSHGGADRRWRSGRPERGGDRAAARLAAHRDPAGRRGAERPRSIDVRPRERIRRRVFHGLRPLRPRQSRGGSWRPPSALSGVRGAIGRHRRA